ncbi:uncharacterized protein LOC143905907 [Temnothorax americanus]|uniref:uncharacterized protein LOC143905907 n=1 Tax=Temnothorax americanus TaxID=1964332 RepID=UPI00406797BE
MLLTTPFEWTQAGEIAFKDIKESLISPQVLMCYDPSLPLILATDASKIGLGAVLSHRLSNGQERPIAYASRTLSPTEQRYPQIDKEALAIVWSNSNADYCSRIPLSTTHDTVFKLRSRDEEDTVYDEFDEFVLCQVKQLPVCAEHIAKETRKDQHLNKIVKILEAECAKHAHAPPKSRDHHWEYPKGPCERVHIDYAGPVAGVMLLIIVDAYSKWVEVKTTNSTTTTATITILDELFSRYGVPVTVVSDNGRQFVSAEFENFLQMSGVKYHKLTAPYHPSTNGQAERYVQTVKNALNAMSTTPGSIQRNLNQFLQQYQKAPHAATGQPPAQLFLGRNIRTRLDLVRPDDVFTRNKEKQQQLNPSFRSFEPEQTIYFLSGNS